MGRALIWISGASRGIGEALARTVPWEGARVIGISRSAPDGVEHLAADLADPSTWSVVGAGFRHELARFDGDRVAFVHAAGTLDPIGYAGEVDDAAYTSNVLLNSASSQVLGHLFLAAARHLRVPRHLLVLTSGAATSVYRGWSSYGAGKAAVDQWVRAVGAEQGAGGVQVLAVGPGTVDTAMQARIRATSEDAFPNRKKFVDLHESGALTDPERVAADLWAVLDAGLANGSVVDLRTLPSAAASS